MDSLQGLASLIVGIHQPCATRHLFVYGCWNIFFATFTVVVLPWSETRSHISCGWTIFISRAPCIPLLSILPCVVHDQDSLVAFIHTSCLCLLGVEWPRSSAIHLECLYEISRPIFSIIVNSITIRTVLSWYHRTADNLSKLVIIILLVILQYIVFCHCRSRLVAFEDAGFILKHMQVRK